jgi:hypothetical protein
MAKVDKSDDRASAAVKIEPSITFSILLDGAGTPNEVGFAGTVPATYLTSRYSFVHALVGRSQDSPRMPTPGTNV